MNFTLAVNNSRMTALITAAGSGSKIWLYTGANAVNADTAAPGTLLSTSVIAGVLGTSSGGTLTIGAVSNAVAVANGTAGYGRLTTSANVALCDFSTIGTSGTEISLNSTSLTNGGTVQITSGVISEQYP